MRKYNLLDETIKALNSSSIPVVELAASANISQNLIFRLKRGDYKDPSARVIQSLHDYLLRHPKKR